MTEKKANPKSRPLPDIKDCCVADIGIDGFAECQMSGPNLCPYALPFGYCFLCQHPRLDEILAKSKERHTAAALS